MKKLFVLSILCSLASCASYQVTYVEPETGPISKITFKTEEDPTKWILVTLFKGSSCEPFSPEGYVGEMYNGGLGSENVWEINTSATSEQIISYEIFHFFGKGEFYLPGTTCSTTGAIDLKNGENYVVDYKSCSAIISVENSSEAIPVIETTGVCEGKR